MKFTVSVTPAPKTHLASAKTCDCFTRLERTVGRTKQCLALRQSRRDMPDTVVSTRHVVENEPGGALPPVAHSSVGKDRIGFKQILLIIFAIFKYLKRGKNEWCSGK